MKRILRFLFSGFFFLSVSCPLVMAQATAQISGTVRDQSGAVLPGVEITATHTATGVARTTITNETGSYVLPNLTIGPYRLEAVLPGFRTFAQTGLVLEVNTSPVINPVLEVGQISETVEVQANAAMVETRNVGVGKVIENERILELPLNGRDITELISLSGAATPATAGINTRNPFVKTVVSIAGGISTGVNYVLDGASHNNPFTNTYMSMPFPDALQEFKVETSAMSAQSGVKSGGSVNLVTKSGTNEIHGNLFEFVRNGMFNARNFFALRRDTLKRNQFGGTIGGPISKNKLFFFAGYQGTTIRQDPSDLVSYVPTPAMLAGDFTAFASPACNVGRQTTLRAPFANNRIDPALFSKPAVAIANKLPAASDACGKVTYGRINIEDDHTAVGKIDYQWSANHSVFGRYLVDSLDNPHPYTLTQNLIMSNGNGGEGLNQAFAIGDTYLFGPNVVNSFRLSANRFTSVKTVASYFSHPDIGVNIFSYLKGTARVSVTGGFSLGAPLGPTKLALYNAVDDVSVVRGNHQMAFGANVAHWRSNNYSDNYAGGNFSFNGAITGLGMADFLTGNAITFDQAPSEHHNNRQWFIGLYGADTWKATQRLTVNYGLRWEPFFPQQNTDRGVGHFDIDALRKGIKTTQFTNAPPGQFFPGDPGFPGLAGMYKQWKNFSPRVGLAWDLSGDGRTSIRAAVGSFYDFPATYFHQGLNISAPWDPHIVLDNVKFDNPWADYPGGNPFPITVGRDVPWHLYNVVTAMDYDTRNASVYQWNLSIQRQIGAEWLVSASYMGSNSIHLWSMQHINPAVYIPGGPCTLGGVTYNPCSTTANTHQRRRLSLENPEVGKYFGYVNKIDNGGTANYNGLLVDIQRRASRGVTVNANYTWSHCISDPFIAGIAVGGTGSGGQTNPANRRFDRGNCTSSAADRRHLFNLTAVAETPQFSNPALRALATGWRLSPILRLQSGGYLSVTTSTDIALSGISGQRVAQILGDPYGDKSFRRYLNPSAFALPARGTLGNMGADSIAGPGHWQFDVALSRSFRFQEGKRFELRAEAFNLTNSTRLNNPTTNLNSNIFGTINSAKDPRIMQFALKYVF